MRQVVLSSGGRQQYKKLSRDIQILISDTFDSTFAKDPFSQPLHLKKLKPPLSGYRVRLGEYRIMFTVETDFIRIYRIKLRKDAYK